VSPRDSGCVLVTGATGFVGQPLTQALIDVGIPVRCAIRSPAAAARTVYGASSCIIGEIGPHTDWSAAVDGVRTVVHLAARVHVMRDTAPDPLAAYRRVNVDGTHGLAEAAAAAGVSRLVYVSSVKVNGEVSGEKPLREVDPAAPADPYAQSKWEAEQRVQDTGQATGLEVVVVRPPLIYGPGVKANFLRLFAAVGRGLPIPLGSVKDNRRSLLYLANMIDFLVVCMEHPAAAGETFFVADDNPPSTAGLVRAIGVAAGRPARLFPVPSTVLRAFARAAGRTATVDRLLGSLVVDTGKARSLLGWSPPFPLEDGLRATAEWARKVGTA
jgi:nucleoside-diphosphate-sugar epimerase